MKAKKPIVPAVKKPENIFAFDTNFPDHPNALHLDQEGRLFLESATFGPGQLEEAELVAVLDWYVMGQQYSPGSTGNIAALCKLASAEIKKLRAQLAERKVV